MVNYKSLFLQQSCSDNYDTFMRSLHNDSPVWDYVVLTASNERQALSYQLQIDARLKDNLLPVKTHYLVIPDRNSKRIGSGGATLQVIRKIALLEGNEDFSKLKILCIHSGGDSKRVPQYSAIGKIFSPVPHALPSGKPSTLFDELLIGVSGIPSRIGQGGMLVLSGDVLLLLNPLQLDFGGEGAYALSVKTSATQGQNHGVFLGNKKGSVQKCLQKKKVSELEASGAIDRLGRVDIDTGAVLLSSEIVNALYSLVNTDRKLDSLADDRTRLSFYVDFLYPFSTEASLEGFLLEKGEGDFTSELISARKILWDALSPYRMRLVHFSPAAFIHFGTSKELLKLFNESAKDYACLGWGEETRSSRKGEGYACYNSRISPKAKIGKGCYIEDSEIGDSVTIGDGCIVSGLTLSNCVVPSGVVLHGLPLESGSYVCRMYSVNDNPKLPIWLGKSIQEPLWETKLFPVRDNMVEAVSATLKMERSGELLSLKESFALADCEAILTRQAELKDKIALDGLMNVIRNKYLMSEASAWCVGANMERLEKGLIEAAKRSNNTLDGFAFKIRAYLLASRLFNKSNYLSECFKTIATATLADEPKPLGKMAKDEAIVSLPVRVNFGGGWSDTPPYCYENGGTVLNGAIKLKGKLPIEAHAKRLEKYSFVLASTDIGVEREFTSIDELRFCSDPGDPFALHKAALLSCGIIPNEESSLEEICFKIGGGLFLNTRVIGIPKGSGLGTSSILSAAVVKALFELFGKEDNEQEVSSRVLILEQIMSTGGGWQDQLGGLSKGFKLITSKPGLSQKPIADHIVLSNKTARELDERFALIYTGQRRLARNLLRDVISRYIASENEPVFALSKIQIVAKQMKDCLVNGDIDALAALFDKHWALSKQIDAGCTNTCIDQILLVIDDMIDGRMICGAGGGGFLQVIMKKGITKQMLSSRLEEVFAESGVRVFDSEFDW